MAWESYCKISFNRLERSSYQLLLDTLKPPHVCISLFLAVFPDVKAYYTLGAICMLSCSGLYCTLSDAIVAAIFLSTSWILNFSLFIILFFWVLYLASPFSIWHLEHSLYQYYMYHTCLTHDNSAVSFFNP